MEKNYTEPKFALVRTDAPARIFFAASDAPAAGPTATLGPVTKTPGTW